MVDKIEVIYVDWGAASFQPGKKPYIRMNKAFKKNMRLHDAVLEHEMEHYANSNKASFGLTSKDYLMDVPAMFGLGGGPDGINTFILKHPKTWSTFCPIWFYKDRGEWNLHIAPISLTIYLLMFLLGGVLL